MGHFSTVTVIAIALSIVLVQSANINKGNTEINPFIVGGQDAVAGQFPYQVSVRYNGSHVCGGTLISKLWIVTAAHCSPLDIEYYSAKVDTLNRTSGGKEFKVVKKIVHSLYDSNNNQNDIAVMKLNQSVVFNANVRPITLPKQNQTIPVGINSTVSGWGKLTEGGVAADKLQYVITPVVSNEECQSSYTNSYTIYFSMFCAGFKAGGHASCQGDSGGPVVATLNKRVTLIGVVSWGIGCARPVYYDVNTRVPSFRKWITENTGV